MIREEDQSHTASQRCSLMARTGEQQFVTGGLWARLCTRTFCVLLRPLLMSPSGRYDVHSYRPAEYGSGSRQSWFEVLQIQRPGDVAKRLLVLTARGDGVGGGPHMAYALRKALRWLTRSIPTRTLHVILVWGRSWCARFGREVCNWCRVAKSEERSCWVIPHFHFSTTLCGFTNLRHRSTNYWALTVYIRGVARQVPFYPCHRT